MFIALLVTALRPDSPWFISTLGWNYHYFLCLLKRNVIYMDEHYEMHAQEQLNTELSPSNKKSPLLKRFHFCNCFSVERGEGGKAGQFGLAIVND